jgi:hypothetical protein
MSSSRNSINPQLRKAFTTSTAASVYRKQNYAAYDNVASKMVRGEVTPLAIEDNDIQLNSAQDPFLKGALSRSLERIRDNNNILQLLPDISLAIEIIIGGVLSPKDLMTTTLTFKCNDGAFNDKLAVRLLSVVDNYFVSSYKLIDELPKMLRDIIAKTGSYPIAVLPETSVDYIINSNSRVTLESIKMGVGDNGKLKPLGFIANARKANTAMEEVSLFDLLENRPGNGANIPFDSDLTQLKMEDGTKISAGVSITDNFDALKLPTLQRRVSSQYQQAEIERRRETIKKYAPGQTLRYSNESMTAVDASESNEAVSLNSSDVQRSQKEKDVLNKLYPDRQFSSLPIMRVKPKSALSKPTFGHPLAMKIPTEAVVPVYSPTDPSDHLGYLVALDATGNPLRLSDYESIYRSLSASSNTSSSSVTSWMIQQSANNTSPSFQQGNLGYTSSALAQAVPIYQQFLESDILDRLTRGVLGSGISIGKNDELYRLMLARACAGRNTQMLYLPASLMAYMAIDWDEFGLGKTMLDDSKTLAALRSFNLFVNSMAATKNAITKRVLNVQLDPAEKNPQKALEVIMHEFARGTQHEYPLTNNPVDQINYLQMAGVQLQVQDHPRLPNTTVGVDYIDNMYKPIDTAFDDYLKKMHTMSLGLSPEVVDGAGSADFATQTIYANVMTQRRIKMISEAFSRAITGFVKLYTYNSQILMDELTNVVKDTGMKFKDQLGEMMSDEDVAVKFLDNLEVTLPLPDTTSVKEQKEQYDEIVDFYDKAIDQFFTEDFLTQEDLGIIGADNIDKTKAFIKAHFVRKWMRENGIRTELFDLLIRDEEGKPMIDILQEKENYMDIIGDSILTMFAQRKRRVNKLDKKADKINEKFPTEDAGMGDDNYGGGNDTYNDYSFDGGDGGDEIPEPEPIEETVENNSEETNAESETTEETSPEKTDGEESTDGEK